MTKHNDDELPLRNQIVNCFSGIEISPSVNTINNLEQLIKQREEQVAREARQSELEMFKKIPVQDMSRSVTSHISRRSRQLTINHKAGDDE